MNSRVAALLCVLLSACGGGLSEGYFGADAFYHSAFPYRVRFAQDQSLLGEDWVLDNFYADARGRQRAKDTGAYVGKVRIDLDGDGEAERLVEVPIYDVKLVHRRTDAVMWMSTIPLASRWAQTDLSVVAASYVEAVSGVGYVVTDLGVAAQRGYSTRVISERALTLWNRPAYEFTFEVANISQLELSEESRTRMVRILLVRPPYGWQLERRKPEVPMLMVLGVSTLPDQFASSVPSFERLVNQVDMAYDDALNQYGAQVVACLPGATAVDVAIDVSREGEVTSVGRARATTDAPGSRRPSSERTCVEELLDGQHLAATGKKRSLRWRFTSDAAGLPPPVAYSTAAEPVSAQATEAPAEASTTTPADMQTVTDPTAAASSTSPETAAAPTAAPQDAEANLRAAIVAKKAAIVACVGKTPLAVNVRYEAGTVTASLRRPLTGTPEEQCVQHVLRELTMPATATGTLIHVIE